MSDYTQLSFPELAIRGQVNGAAKYKKQLDIYEGVARFSTAVSQAAAGKVVPFRCFYASVLFTRLSTVSVSLLSLLPRNRLVQSSFEHWDFVSIATLSRMLIEGYYIFHYLTVDPVSEHEAECRFLLCELHDGVEQLKLFRFLKVAKEKLSEVTQGIKNSRDKLRRNKFFACFSEKRKQDLLKGEHFVYLTRQEVSDRFGVDSAINKFFHRLLSNQVHNSPFSFFSISQNRGRGLENDAERDYIALTVGYVTGHLSIAILDMITLFPEIAQDLEPRKLSLIKYLARDARNWSTLSNMF